MHGDVTLDTAQFQQAAQAAMQQAAQLEQALAGLAAPARTLSENLGAQAAAAQQAGAGLEQYATSAQRTGTRVTMLYTSQRQLAESMGQGAQAAQAAGTATAQVGEAANAAAGGVQRMSEAEYALLQAENEAARAARAAEQAQQDEGQAAATAAQALEQQTQAVKLTATAHRELTENTSRLSSAINGINLSQFTSSISNLINPTTLLSTALGVGVVSGVTAASQKLGSLINTAVQVGAAFEQSTAKLEAWATLSHQQATEISDAFTSGAVGFTQSADAETQALAQIAPQLEVVNRGALTTKQAMQEMAAATDLANATGQSLESSARALSQVQLTFGHSMQQAAQDAGTLAAAQELLGQSSQSVAQLVGRLHDRFGPLAPDLQQTISLMVQFEQAGVTGSRGMMVMSTGVDHLLSNTPKVNQELDLLGVSVKDEAGAFRSWGEVFPELLSALGKLSPAERTAAEEILFGTTAAQAWNQVINQGIEGSDAATRAVLQHSDAHKQAAIQTETFKGQLNQLKNALGDVWIKIDEGLPKLAKQVEYSQNAGAAAEEQARKVKASANEEVSALAQAAAAKEADYEAQRRRIGGDQQAALASNGFAADLELANRQLDAEREKLGDSVSIFRQVADGTLDLARATKQLANDSRRASDLRLQAEQDFKQGFIDTGMAVMQEVDALNQGDRDLASTWEETARRTRAADQDRQRAERETASAIHQSIMDQIGDRLILAAAERKIADAGGQLSADEVTTIRNKASEEQAAADRQGQANQRAADLSTQAAQARMKGLYDVASALEHEAAAYATGDKAGEQYWKNQAALATTASELQMRAVKQETTTTTQYIGEAAKAEHDANMARIEGNTQLAQSYENLAAAIRSGDAGTVAQARQQLTDLQDRQAETQKLAQVQKQQSQQAMQLASEEADAFHQARMEEIKGNADLAASYVALGNAIASGDETSVAAARQALRDLQNQRQEYDATQQQAKKLHSEELQRANDLESAVHSANMAAIEGNTALADSYRALANVIAGGGDTGDAKLQLKQLQDQQAEQQKLQQITDQRAKDERSGADSITAAQTRHGEQAEKFNDLMSGSYLKRHQATEQAVADERKLGDQYKDSAQKAYADYDRFYSAYIQWENQRIQLLQQGDNEGAKAAENNAQYFKTMSEQAGKAFDNLTGKAEEYYKQADADQQTLDSKNVPSVLTKTLQTLQEMTTSASEAYDAIHKIVNQPSQEENVLGARLAANKEEIARITAPYIERGQPVPLNSVDFQRLQQLGRDDQGIQAQIALLQAHRKTLDAGALAASGNAPTISQDEQVTAAGAEALARRTASTANTLGAAAAGLAAAASVVEGVGQNVISGVGGTAAPNVIIGSRTAIPPTTVAPAPIAVPATAVGAGEGVSGQTLTVNVLMNGSVVGQAAAEHIYDGLQLSVGIAPTV